MRGERGVVSPKDDPALLRCSTVLREVGPNEDKVRTQLLRDETGHGTAHAEPPGLVVGSADHRHSAHGHRDRAERRVVAHFDCREEHIHVDDDPHVQGLPFHLRLESADQHRHPPLGQLAFDG